MPGQKDDPQLNIEQIILHEKELELIYNTVTDVLYMIDVEEDGRFKFRSVNQSFLRATGLTEEQVVGKYVEQVIPAPSVDLVLTNYNKAIDTHSTVNWEEVSVYPAGTKYGQVSITPVFNEEGRCIRMVGSVHDITEKKEKDIAIAEVIREREEVLSQLVNRNKDLEQFTYVISHNLRSPVANIIGLAEALRTIDPAKDDFYPILHDVSESVRKLDSVITDLNSIIQVRGHNSELKEIVSLQMIIDDIKLSIADLVKSENVTINYTCESRTHIYSIRTHIYSIFYNLILNSIKYRKPDTSPVIDIHCFDKEEKIQISFTDNGKGIDLEKHKDQIFGFYKRFDTSVKGKGLGLFLVKTQVEALDGSITVNSKLNEGTQFLISLPMDIDKK